MKLLKIFSYYFLLLIWIQGLVLILDIKNFTRSNKNKEAKLSKNIGFGLITISTILFITAKFISL